MHLSSVGWGARGFPPSPAEGESPQDTSKQAQTEPGGWSQCALSLEQEIMMISEILMV